jgi:hypothetical protein
MEKIKNQSGEEQRAESSTSRKPWDKQCYLGKEKIPGVKDIIDMAREISEDRDRCLFVLTYLTAGRMQEIVRYNHNKENRSSIKKSDIVIQEREGRKILLINLRNEKNLNKHRKEIPVPLDLPENKDFFNLIITYLNSIGNNDEMFPIGYKRAYAILNRINPNWNPHWIRHIRLTHLVTVYGYREYQLTMYAGWSDPRPAKAYLQMRWEDLLY